MSIKFHSSVLITNNFESMKSFYTQGMGLQIKDDFGTCIGFVCGLSIWKMGENQPLAKTLGRTFHTDGNKNLEMCFETENFDTDVVHVKSFGIKLIHDIQTETWGQKTIRFYDPDENMIELGETIPTFVKRLHKEGMAIEEVAKKTGVPQEQVEQFIVLDS